MARQAIQASLPESSVAMTLNRSAAPASKAYTEHRAMLRRRRWSRRQPGELFPGAFPTSYPALPACAADPPGSLIRQRIIGDIPV